MSEKHLWEYDHDYYCSPENYYSNDTVRDFSSWKSFTEQENFDFFDMMDYNLLFRWDWQKFKEGDLDEGDDMSDLLSLFFMLQRKGGYICRQIRVTEDDEPVIREWLKVRAEYLRELWSPLLGASND